MRDRPLPVRPHVLEAGKHSQLPRARGANLPATGTHLATCGQPQRMPNEHAMGAIWRLASGSVVFKVSSPWFNAYNRRQKDWVHHVPVAADWVDFELATSLAASAEPRVLDRLAAIAVNARALAAEFTYEAEVDRVGRELDAVWGVGAARAAAAP